MAKHFGVIYGILAIHVVHIAFFLWLNIKENASPLRLTQLGFPVIVKSAIRPRRLRRDAKRFLTTFFNHKERKERLRFLLKNKKVERN